ncbi:hypothetical protein EYF80_051055 [Liparis tanakae]|uniref:Uncharacterized protein n=1 Tax=Liparis tanakae TaxID=230148 RepID=A0A4Z2FD07_9TELE|nr:hypothetical protein EYF80_051055 [Liparis tanakae]
MVAAAGRVFSRGVDDEASSRAPVSSSTWTGEDNNNKRGFSRKSQSQISSKEDEDVHLTNPPLEGSTSPQTSRADVDKINERAGSLCLARGLVTPQDRAFQPITVPSSQGPWRARSAHMRNRYSSTRPLTATPPGGRSLGRQPSHREPAGGMAPAMTVLSATVLPST